MKILIIHYNNKSDSFKRITIQEHLYSFKKYSKEQIYYLNAFYGIPKLIINIKFDLIIYHYTFIGLKWSCPQTLLNKYKILKKLNGYKVGIPQDEYINSNYVCQFFSNYNIKTVFTRLPKSEWKKVYPKSKSGLDHYVTVLAGYIDNNQLSELSVHNKPHNKREIDVGYRARKVPYWLGRFGLIKWKLTEKFLEINSKYNLIFNLSNEEKGVLYGNKWYKFLANCRVVLGCEGGASLHDPKGETRQRVDKYVLRHPKATFKEVESVCFPKLDGNLNLSVLSPRHFDSCITKTCQALVEGKYNNILKPNVHYIKIKKDFSNISEVIAKIKNIKYCEKIANNTYRDIVKSGKYSYRKFVELIINHVNKVHPIKLHKTTNKEKLYLVQLRFREAFPIIFCPWTPMKIILIETLLMLECKFNLKRINLYKKIKEKAYEIYVKKV